MKRLVTILLAGALATTLGCSDADRQSQAALDWNAELADRAQLIERLPADTQIYLRVPTLWNLLSAPKDTALAPALASEANQQAIADLQQALGKRLVEQLGPVGGAVNLLLKDLRSPLEVAGLGEADNPMTARFVLSGRFAFDSVAALEERLHELVALAPMARLAAPITDDKPGHLLVGPASFFYQFEPGSQRLTAVAGLQVTAAQLEAVSQWPVNSEHPVLAVEQRFDADRQGAFKWVKGDWAAVGLEQSMPPSERERFREWGVFGLDYIAGGYGVSDGKARMSLELAGDGGRYWDMTLPAAAPLEITTAGEPRWALGVRLPGLEWAETLAQASGAGDTYATGLAEADAQLQEFMSIDLTDLASLLDGRYLLINDRNGVYLVHDDVDVALWQSTIEQLSERFELPYRTISTDGVQLHHLELPGLKQEQGESLADMVDVDPGLQALMTMSMQVGSHLYWVQETNRVVVAQVPQVLIDRHNHPGKTDLQAWFDGSVGEGDPAVLRLGAQTRDTARANYYSYLQMLQALDDILDIGLETADFPTARELDLPEWGHMTMRIDHAAGRTGMHLAFDNHPGDLASSQGVLVTVAMAGILAAIAVPAYQDYVTRAAVNERRLGALQYKAVIADYATEQGALPDVAAGKQLGLPGQSTEPVYYDGERQQLVVHLWDIDGLDSTALLRLTPTLEESGAVVWQCTAVGADVSALPVDCR